MPLEGRVFLSWLGTGWATNTLCYFCLHCSESEASAVLKTAWLYAPFSLELCPHAHIREEWRSLCQQQWLSELQLWLWKPVHGFHYATSGDHVNQIKCTLLIISIVVSFLTHREFRTIFKLPDMQDYVCVFLNFSVSAPSPLPSPLLSTLPLLFSQQLLF